ncbi:MAG: membrane protein insertase YidC [Lachnospiraceae bacterium]|nr:membrane protein insertase YidC [Lachnospiraceae bacterium]
MSIANFLYLFFIYPIEIFIETVFSLSMKVFSDAGISIIFVSLAVQFLVLPLYKRADALQEADRRKQEEMKKWITHIKKTFKKDERFMILSEYYRQQDYEPVMGLRGSLPLLLQVPFFIAAYRYLSGLQMLQGTSFLIIKDLGSPDGLLRITLPVIGTVSVNILPVLMTAINLISGAIYTKGFQFKEKLQLYVTALVFLVLLYGSPAGLVFYWTLNNLFSLLKNVVMKILHLPKKKKEETKETVQRKGVSFIIPALCMVFLAGMWIPSAAVSDSPLEFLIRGHFADPNIFVFEAFAVAAGIFVLWCGLFYLLSEGRKKPVFPAVLAVMFACGLCQMFFFSRRLGNMSNIMVYDFEPKTAMPGMLINLAVLVCVAAVVLFLQKKFPVLLERGLSILLVGMVVISVLNVVKTERTISANAYVKDDAAYTEVYPSYTLSKKGRNVMVIMMDRALSGYVPYIMEEFPEIREQFEGFTYYPNTYSYGACTLTGGPALYGGYDFDPFLLDSDREHLQERLDASIRFLPYNFSAAGFDCTVFDPPDYINLSGTDLQGFFDDIDNTRAYNTGGVFKSPKQAAEDYDYLHKWSVHNQIRHSIYLLVPNFLRSLLYDDGNYLSQDKVRKDLVLSDEVRSMELVSEMAEISEGDGDNLFVYTNLAAHSYAELQLPDFTFEDNVDNSALIGEWNAKLKAPGAMPLDDMTDRDRFKSYCANVAALRGLGKWMERLKKAGVYDNTRVIIVADHGFYVFAFPQMIYEGGTSFEQFNPVLMVKDFGADTYTTSEEFMSNADTCAIAMEGIIKEPVDPYTGEKAEITRPESDGTVQVSDVHEYDGLQRRLYELHDDVRDPENWRVTFAE